MTITLHYSEELIRRAVLTFWLRCTGLRFGIAILIALASLAYLVQIGDRSWYVGVIGTVIAFGLILAIAIYVVHYLGLMRRFRRLKTLESTLELGEKTFRMTSGLGSTELVWTVVTEVWCFPDLWLVFFSPSQFITLPTADLHGEAGEFILQKVRLHRGKVS